MKLMLNAFVTMLGMLSLSVHAFDDYRCTIEKISFSTGDSGDVYEMYKKLYLGKDFTVERKTGLMVGSIKNSYVTKPEVIDIGSKENSYKVVTTLRLEDGAGRGTNVYYLNIAEHNESQNKPFIYVDNDIVYFGKCTHF